MQQVNEAVKGYRADVQGLRALAVVLVILYHYRFPGISAGFVGVDVFFVISGFVITQLLQRSISAGKFRFRDFYARRIRRLVPLFLLVSTVTFLMISPFYIGDAYYIFAKSWLASLIGLSNIYYYQELTQYFSPETWSLSLLHTWSLAVEEQFYLLWPALLYGVYRFRGRLFSGGFFVLLTLAALALSVWQAESQPTAAYYLLPARLFEFFLGCGVALYTERMPRPGRAAAELLAGGGTLMIIASAVLLSEAVHFPGYNALWPTLGCAMVIYAGCYQHTFTGRLLSLPPMVFLGGISYSLYLWHWPPVALLHYQLVELTWLNRAVILAVVVLVSWLSYRFVENRYRSRPWSFRKSFMVFIFLPLLVIWAIQSTIRLADDLSFRIPEERRELYKIIAQNNTADLYKSCFKAPPQAFDQSARCLFGANQQAPNALLIGDSHAISLLGFLEQMIEGTDLSVLVITRASTPFLTPGLSQQAFADPDKVVRNTAIADYLESQQPMTVFVSAWWDSYLAAPVYQQLFSETVAWIRGQGHRVVMLEDVPALPSASYAECLLKNMQDCSIAAGPVNHKLAPFLQLKASLQQRFPDMLWINPRQAICDEVRCQTVLNGVPLYRDESHLNYLGAQQIGREYLARFANPLRELNSAE